MKIQGENMSLVVLPKMKGGVVQSGVEKKRPKTDR